MILVQIEQLPWKTFVSMPNSVKDAISSHFIETYNLDGDVVAGAVNDKDSLGVISRCLTQSIGVAFGVIKSDGGIATIAKMPSIVTAAPPPVVEEEDEIGEDDVEAVPAPVDPTIPTPAHPLVVARTTEVNPRIYNVRNLIDRSDVIAEANIHDHLYRNRNTSCNSNAERRLALMKRYEETVRALIVTQKEIDELSATSSTDTAVKSVMDQIKRIKDGMPGNKINDIFVSSNYIVIKTQPIHANAGGDDQRLLGKIMFTVPLKGMLSDGFKDELVQIQPLDFVFRVGTTDGAVAALAPHVNGDGRFCYGNAAEHMIQAYVRRDLISLVDIMIRFLENPNMNDVMGKNILHWPKVGANVVV